MKIQKLDLCMTKFFLKGFSRLELIPVLAASPSIYTSLLPQLLTQPSLFFYTFILSTFYFLLFYFFTFSKLDMTCPPSPYTPLSFSTSYTTPSLSYYSTFYFLWVFKFRAETSLQHFSNWFDGVQTSLVLMSVDSFIVAAIQCYLQPSLMQSCSQSKCIELWGESRGSRATVTNWSSFLRRN